MTFDEQTREILLDFQQTEINEHRLYLHLASRTDGKNREILEHIARDESRHAREWEKYTGQQLEPQWWVVWKYKILARLLGITFAIKMMERGEKRQEANYGRIVDRIPEAEEVIREEHEHEDMLLNMIDEERIRYMSSVVLGLNDALVELTGALAGLTLALQVTRLIAVAGLITGIAASLSMAASEYLSQKSEVERRNPARAAVYTGIAYIFTVLLLVCPYFFLSSATAALALTLALALLVIFVFSYYMAVVKEMAFGPLWREMVFLSLGVALVSFGIGWLARTVLNIEV